MRILIIGGGEVGHALGRALAADHGIFVVDHDADVGERFADMRRVEGLAVVAGTWAVLALAAALPFVAAGMAPIDALFESMSGLTTTGATVIRDFADFGRGVFFWRSLTQWLGGMGVIALFVAVLPRLSIAGRQLFFAEAPGPTDEKLTAHCCSLQSSIKNRPPAVQLGGVAAATDEAGGDDRPGCHTRPVARRAVLPVETRDDLDDTRNVAAG